MDDAEALPPLPVITRDVGPASSGGASKTEKVKVRMPNGWIVDAHAKFAVDVNGKDIAEQGRWGLMAELIASALAREIGADGPNYRVAVLPPGVLIALRDGVVPASGTAIATPSLSSATDVNGPPMLADFSTHNIARVVLIDTLLQAGDRGHNMIRGGAPIELHSVDYASTLSPERAGGAVAAPVLIIDPLIEARIIAEPESLRELAKEVAASLTDAKIEVLIAAVPVELSPDDDQKQRLRQSLRQRRDALVQLVEDRFPTPKATP
jgi:hypothetical protein